MNFLVFLGPPGSGKGTQAQVLSSQHSDVVHFATGQILRDLIASDSELGKSVASFVNNGQYITDQMMFDILVEKLEGCQNAKYVILDGFPRTLEQVKLLTQYEKKCGAPVKKVVYFDINHDILIERLSGRYNCSTCGAVYHKVNKKPVVENCCDICHLDNFSQRLDDTEVVVKKRLQVYHEQTQSLVNYYEEVGLLTEVDAALPIEDIFKIINELMYSS